MYVQITTRCNMSCEHCGMNCTAKGDDMSFETFKAALSFADFVTLGGGEPTIHPDFCQFLLYAIAHCDGVFVITNGSMTDISLAMAKMNCETFGCELSLDDFHDPIDPKVVSAFKKIDSIRDTSRNLIKAGRCDWGREDKCICDGETFVKPNGDIHQCGCEDSPKVGTVFEDEWSRKDNEWNCHKNLDSTH